MYIRRITQVEAVLSARHLFDASPLPEATERFLADERHHLLIAYVDGAPAGMITGVEMTHPDKGTEMFLYELGVEEAFGGRGLGRALAAALADLAPRSRLLRDVGRHRRGQPGGAGDLPARRRRTGEEAGDARLDVQPAVSLATGACRVSRAVYPGLGNAAQISRVTELR
jgi:GNAT superfamily N-acetyltransferase